MSSEKHNPDTIAAGRKIAQRFGLRLNDEDLAQLVADVTELVGSEQRPPRHWLLGVKQIAAALGVSHDKAVILMDLDEAPDPFHQWEHAGPVWRAGDIYDFISAKDDD